MGELNLAQTLISDEGANAIGPALQVNTVLKELCGAKAFGTAPWRGPPPKTKKKGASSNTTLTTLDLQKNKIGQCWHEFARAAREKNNGAEAEFSEVVNLDSSLLAWSAVLHHTPLQV